MGNLFVYYQQNGCHISHLNNIPVNIIDFKINTSFESTYIQFVYVLNILLQFIGWEISPHHQKMVSTWRGWWKQWGRILKFINWLFWKPISMNKINLTPSNHCYFPPTVIHKLNDNPVTCFGPFLQIRFLIWTIFKQLTV